MLEIHGGVGEAGGRGDSAGFEELAFPLLGGGVIDLEDAEARVRVAVGEGVEPGSEEDILGDSAGYGPGEQVFGVAAACDQEGAEGDGEGLVEFGDGLVDLREIVGAEDGDGDGVVEDEWLRIVELVRGATHGYAESGAGGGCMLHPY